jgi:hypothetical protein
MLLAALADVSELAPAAPLWSRLLFESPVIAGIIGVALGLGARAAARSGGRARLGDALLLAGLLLAGAAALAGTLVETDRERLSASARAFIDAAARGDAAAAEALLAPNIALSSGGASVSRNRQWLLDAVENMDTTIESHRFTDRGVRRERRGYATTRVFVGATFTPATGGGTVPTHWDLAWRKDPDRGWIITGIDCLAIWGQEPSSVWVGWADRLAR